MMPYEVRRCTRTAVRARDKQRVVKRKRTSLNSLCTKALVQNITKLQISHRPSVLLLPYPNGEIQKSRGARVLRYATLTNEYFVPHPLHAWLDQCPRGLTDGGGGSDILV
ncbi:hypothetical protein NDU88_006901 [Pleurodeles waltl]|uniref:Uncharacterized protein n=1 Tax=Pleurodeles waltl TaxID=8319 RepID=A0AAV7N1U0_PLEWA|nr:hypothetical protein NDU88_006901 [Pleurodeles waltl]